MQQQQQLTNLMQQQQQQLTNLMQQQQQLTNLMQQQQQPQELTNLNGGTGTGTESEIETSSSQNSGCMLSEVSRRGSGRRTPIGGGQIGPMSCADLERLLVPRPSGVGLESWLRVALSGSGARPSACWVVMNLPSKKTQLNFWLIQIEVIELCLWKSWKFVASVEIFMVRKSIILCFQSCRVGQAGFF